MQKAVVLLVFIGLFMTRCTKSSDSVTPVTQTKSQLIAKTWQMQAFTGTILASGLSIPIYTKGGNSNLADYSKYQLALTSDGKFSLFDGQSKTGTWQLLTNDTQLVLTFSDGSKTTYTVDTASATNLNLNYQILPTTQNPTEKGYLAQAQALGQDPTKGITISTKLIPQ